MCRGLGLRLAEAFWLLAQLSVLFGWLALQAGDGMTSLA